MTSGIYGDTTHDLHDAWTKCVLREDDDKAAEAGEVVLRRTLPNAALQPLFNQVQLFPSQSQIFEMVQCAQDCANQRSKSLSESSSSYSSSGESLRVSLTPPGVASSSSPSSPTERRSGSLTFGEFCIFATELKKYYDSHDSSLGGRHGHPHHHRYHRNYRHFHSPNHHQNKHNRQQSPLKSSSGPASCPVASASSVDKARRNELLRTQKSTASAYDVFLGGSCNPTTWRQDAAIPHLKGQGITYYNPQQSNWVPEMIELEHQAKQTSQIILLVMNEKTRNVVSNIEACYLAGARRRVIVVLQRYPRTGHAINGTPVNEAEWQDLDGAMTTVHDLVERQGLPVFSDLSVALKCTSKVLKEGVSIESLGLSDQAQPVKLAHLQIGDKLVRLREAFDTLDTTRCGKISLADIRMAFRIHAHRDLSQKDLRQIVTAHDIPVAKKGNSLPLEQVMIDFDHFCCIMAEFKNKNKKNRSGDSRSGRRNKASRVIRSVFHPIHKIASWMSPSSSDSNGSGSSQDRHQMPSNSPSPVPADGQMMKGRGSQMRDVYLGGTLLRSSRWREKEAIPSLKKHGLTFFTPSAPSRRLIPLEAAAMDNSRVLLFVIEGCARGVSAMCEAAYYIGMGATVVLCLQKIPEDAMLSGEKLTKCALKDYNRGRCYLSDFANREGVPVFEEVSEAIECILQKCKSLR